MLNVRVMFNRQKLNKNINEKFETYAKKCEKAALIIGKEAVKVMVRDLQIRAKDYSGHLAMMFHATVGREKDWIWVNLADKNKLNYEAPYWYVLNFGFAHKKQGVPYVPPKTVGYWEGNKFVHTGKSGGLKRTKSGKYQLLKGNILMQPKKPITPINYLTVGMNFILDNMHKVTKFVSRVKI